MELLLTVFAEITAMVHPTALFNTMSAELRFVPLYPLNLTTTTDSNTLRLFHLPLPLSPPCHLPTYSLTHTTHCHHYLTPSRRRPRITTRSGCSAST